MSIVFAILIILGYIGVVFKQRLGFIVQLIGCLGMIILYAYIDSGVVLVNGVFTFINIYGFFKWKKENE